MEFEYYSKTQPNLIVPKVKEAIDNVIETNDKGSTVSEIIANRMYNFYNDYLRENMFIIIVILIFVVFLIYRYYKTKEEKQKKQAKLEKEKEESQENQQYIENYQDLSLNEIQKQTDHLMYNDQPHFNPLFSVSTQQTPVNYPPDKLPINLPNQGMTYTRSLDNSYPQPYPAFNAPAYNYNNVYKNDTRSYYNGTYNTYQHPNDTNIQNPLGFSTKFNSTTGNFVGPMTDLNQSVINEYNRLGRQKEDDMVKGMFSNYKPTLIPAYAT